MKVALIDDDPILLSQLYCLVEAELSSIGDTAHQIDTYPSGEEFLSRWQAGKYDLIILDIYMEKQNGVEVAQVIRQTDENVRLAFCTSSNEFASETYAVNARDYLQKPITAEKITRLFRKLELEKMELSRLVSLPDGHRVMLRSILYTEYFDHSVTVHTKKDAPYRLRMSFAEIENLLMPYGYFYSPIKSVMINFYEVAKLTANSFLMKDGKDQPITRRNYKEAKELYARFQFRTLTKEVDL